MKHCHFPAFFSLRRPLLGILANDSNKREWAREWDSRVHLVFQGEGTREGKREQKRRCSEGDI